MKNNLLEQMMESINISSFISFFYHYHNIDVTPPKSDKYALTFSAANYPSEGSLDNFGMKIKNESQDKVKKIMPQIKIFVYRLIPALIEFQERYPKTYVVKPYSIFLNYGIMKKKSKFFKRDTAKTSSIEIPPKLRLFGLSPMFVTCIPEDQRIFLDNIGEVTKLESRSKINRKELTSFSL